MIANVVMFSTWNVAPHQRTYQGCGSTTHQINDLLSTQHDPILITSLLELLHPSGQWKINLLTPEKVTGGCPQNWTSNISWCVSIMFPLFHGHKCAPPQFEPNQIYPNIYIYIYYTLWQTNIDLENEQLLVETNLPSPICQGRIVNSLEGFF